MDDVLLITSDSHSCLSYNAGSAPSRNHSQKLIAWILQVLTVCELAVMFHWFSFARHLSRIDFRPCDHSYTWEALAFCPQRVGVRWLCFRPPHNHAWSAEASFGLPLLVSGSWLPVVSLNNHENSRLQAHSSSRSHYTGKNSTNSR